MPGNERVSAEQARVLRHGYYACISYVDAQVGKLLETLERLALHDNTIVVLWGEHGFALGEEDRWCKGTNFELDTRVPLLVRIPNMAEPGVPTEALIEAVDIYPTLAALAGRRRPRNWTESVSYRSWMIRPLAPAIVHSANSPDRGSRAGRR